MRRELVQIVRADHELVCADHLGALWVQRGDAWALQQAAVDAAGEPVVLLHVRAAGHRLLALDTDGALRELRGNAWVLLMDAPDDGDPEA